VVRFQIRESAIPAVHIGETIRDRTITNRPPNHIITRIMIVLHPPRIRPDIMTTVNLSKSMDRQAIIVMCHRVEPNLNPRIVVETTVAAIHLLAEELTGHPHLTTWNTGSSSRVPRKILS